MLVDMHSSWLVVNSIVGCSNSCKYCLLQDLEHHKCFPKVLGSPDAAIRELIKYKYYSEKIPVCLFPNTDIFLNEENIQYLLETLDVIEREGLRNDFVLITKCFIPDKVLTRLKNFQRKGRNIVVYLSYSGLGKELEPFVDHAAILSNFQRLHDIDIPIVHYYRPFLPQNSKPEQIRKVLDFIHSYTPVSAVMGLMNVLTMLHKQNFWEELKSVDEVTLKSATSIWPRDAWNYFYKNYDRKQYFYQTNTCALCTILKKPALQYFNTYECRNLNCCDPEQRKRCCTHILEEEKIVKELDILLRSLGITGDYSYQFDKEEGLELIGLPLDVKALAYLSYVLGVKVYMKKGQALNNIYPSTLSGARAFVFKEKSYGKTD